MSQTTDQTNQPAVAEENSASVATTAEAATEDGDTVTVVLPRSVELVYRTGRGNSLLDIGASARALAAGASPQVEQPAQVASVVLRRAFRPRVTVFGILERGLGQRFSLDNGIALQTVLDHWLGQGSRQAPYDGDVQLSDVPRIFQSNGSSPWSNALKKWDPVSPPAPSPSPSGWREHLGSVGCAVRSGPAHEELAPRRRRHRRKRKGCTRCGASGSRGRCGGRHARGNARWWSVQSISRGGCNARTVPRARVVKVQTWPAELRGDLITACRFLAASMTASAATADEACAEADRHRVISLDDICPLCTRGMAVVLAGDYSPPSAPHVCVCLIRCPADCNKPVGT